MLTKLFVLTSLLVIGLSIYVRWTGAPLCVPEMYFQDQYWGLEPERVDDPSIYPFKINIDDKVLFDLQDRLSKTRFLEQSFEHENFSYGFNTLYLKSLVDVWLKKYDWRKQEKYLNSLPQFKTEIEGLQIHFVHVKPKKVMMDGEKKPILLVHSWPGSTIEFYKLIPHLVEDGFEVVAPSLPGYGFSGAPHRPGFDVMHAGRVLGKLMSKLNHEKFYYHGGDWGSIVGKAISVLQPERVLGYHSTLPNIQFSLKIIFKILIAEYLSPTLIYDNPQVEFARLHPLKQRMALILQETGYFHLQATKPDTSGIALNDSPAGLAAYILEKFSTWTHPSNVNKPNGGLTEKYSVDDLLTNVMIYWLSGSISSSNRLYKEYISVPNFSKYVVKVPVSFLLPKNELLLLPPTLLKTTYPDIVQIHELGTGGHFSAFEEPKLVAEDIKSFVFAASSGPVAAKRVTY